MDKDVTVLAAPFDTVPRASSEDCATVLNPVLVARIGRQARNGHGVTGHLRGILRIRRINPIRRSLDTVLRPAGRAGRGGPCYRARCPVRRRVRG